MGSTVIVALPALNDKVNRISSEKIPHMTLLFLDELVGEELTKVLEYVAHATSHLSPFGTTVDYRGTLGDDKADVLFMEDNSWDLKRVKEFRHHLLMDNTIRKAYDSVEQYPQWTPHVTLGYPQTPAKEDTSEYPGVSYVQFDRIAVWNEQDSGPEFRLEYEDHPMEVRMSDMTTEELGEALSGDILKHAGVKGMKWGVRKDYGHEGQKIKTKKLAKVDAKFEKSIENVNKGRGNRDLHNAVVSRLNQRTRDLNESDEYRNADLNDPETRTRYNKAANEIVMRTFEDGIREVYGSNASGTKQGVYNRATDKIDIVDRDVRHADTTVPDFVVKLTRSERGYITDVDLIELDDDGNELKHYGVKGMKWGVRKVDRAAQVTRTQDSPPKRGSKDVTVTQRRAGTYSKAKGGERNVATDEAVKAVAGRQKAKKSTTDALTNDELRATIERMQLEQQFTALSKKSDRRSRGRKIVEYLLTPQPVPQQQGKKKKKK